MKLFTPYKLGSLLLPNRIIRSATFEGMADENGFLTNEYLQFYDKLSRQKIGAIICGFSYISTGGKAMQPGQAGIDSPDKIPLFKKLTESVHKNNSYIFMQLVHTGRQTLSDATKQKIVSSSTVKSIYFKQRPEALSVTEIEAIIEKFGNAALYCMQAGFDGIQLHAAHGYLIHQFISPAINKRKDKYSIDKKTKISTIFLKEIVENIREKCGHSFPVIIKISGGDDLSHEFSRQQFVSLISGLNDMALDAIEISYGTMDFALNIIRGDIPVNLILKYNPIYKTDNEILKFLRKTVLIPFLKYKIKPFTPHYNLKYAELAKAYTGKPVICVGGFRNAREMESALDKQTDLISLCRPFICEPDFVVKIESNPDYQSKCTNCNYCSIMCDTERITQCYRNKLKS
jgi:2,4-dienoyl-CoA reductase-like NADH-dependent reductase (Old Yellow Enzyme family)